MTSDGKAATEKNPTTEHSDGRLPQCVKFCEVVSKNTSVVRTIGEYEKSKIQENFSLFMRNTNPSSTELVLYLNSSTHIIATPICTISLSIENQTDEKIITLKPSTFFSILTDCIGTPEATSKASIPATFFVASIFLRCPSCKFRQLFELKTLNDTPACPNCNKDLSILDWTGRFSTTNISIIEITNAFAIKFLKSYGFLERKNGLWVKDEKGIYSYVDFRGRKIPSFYAFSNNPALNTKKLPPLLDAIKKHLQPYYERPTSHEIATKKSRAEGILNLKNVPDPDELNALILQLQEKGIDVIGHLKNLNETYIPQHPTVSVSQELNNEKNINVFKCPECGSNESITIKNNAGQAERCLKCNHTIIKEDAKIGIGDKKGKKGIDAAFF